MIGIDMKPDLQMCLITFELPEGMLNYKTVVSLLKLNELQGESLKSLPNRLQRITKDPL